jgi:hypothetical protein
LGAVVCAGVVVSEPVVVVLAAAYVRGVVVIGVEGVEIIFEDLYYVVVVVVVVAHLLIMI